MKNLKKVLGLTIVGSLYAVAAYAGTGEASTVNISYFDTFAYGNQAAMTGATTVTGYLNPTYSDNTCWYELTNSKGSIVQQAKASIGFNGTLFTANVATADYKLNLNPDGANYKGCVASGKAQN